VWQSFKRIEEAALRQARFCVFTTPGAARDYRERYPESSNRIEVLENGYDEESFAGLPVDAASREPLRPGVFTLLHSGVVYPSERDPSQFFAALRQLVDSGSLRRDELNVRFRAAAHDAVLVELARQHGVLDMIDLVPPIPYRGALEEMIRADGLLILQAANCNDQIPAKLYEYLRAGRPIIALTDPTGDTAGAMRRAGLDSFAPLDSSAAIAARLERFIASVRAGREQAPDAAFVAKASRRERARVLSGLLARAQEPIVGSDSNHF
jgi:glycosyltransferase involved in cell wall biosynthesis